jgi:hypothetical protein
MTRVVLFLGKAKILFVAVVLLGSFMLASPLAAHAVYEAPLVQQASGGCFGCSSTTSTASFDAPVTGGNLIVVGIASAYEPTGIAGSFSVSDTLESSYVQAASHCEVPGIASCAAIFYATAPSSGSDTVTVTVNNADNPNSIDIFVYELIGVTTAGSATGTGQGFGEIVAPVHLIRWDTRSLPDTPPPQFSVSTTSTSFTDQAFLLGVVSAGAVVDPTFTAGAGFTASAPSSGSDDGFAQYSLSGVTSPTTFPGTLTEFAGPWSEVGLALNYPSPTSTPICPSTFGGSLMPAGATFADGFGNTWLAPSGNLNGGILSSYFFPGPEGIAPPPMLAGWAGDYGTYGGQQGWIIAFYCAA